MLNNNSAIYAKNRGSLPQFNKNNPTKSQPFWQQRPSILNDSNNTNQFIKKQESSNILVPCLNCEDLIPLDLIDRHSQKCTTVSKRVTAVNKSPQMFDEIDFKISKLKDSLIQLINNIKTKEIPVYGLKESIESKIKYLCRACEIAEAVLYVQNLGSIEERRLNDVEEELKILIEGYQGSLSVSLYIERLHSLILQKLMMFKRTSKNRNPTNYSSQTNFFSQKTKDNNDSNQRSNSKNSKYSMGSSRSTQKDQLKTIITEKKQECDQMKNMAAMYQEKTQNSQQMINNLMKINFSSERGGSSTSNLQQSYLSPNPMRNNSQNNFNYQSPDINGRPTLITKFSGSQDRSNQQMEQKSEILTQISSSQWDSDIGNDNYQKNVFQQQQPSEDQLQRIFYSKCLNLKMKLANNHPSQKIPVSLLFKEAIKKNLNQQQWDDFITKAMQSPYEYLDMNKVNSHNNQRLVKNNLKGMTQDSQFRHKMQNL